MLRNQSPDGRLAAAYRSIARSALVKLIDVMRERDRLKTALEKATAASHVGHDAAAAVDERLARGSASNEQSTTGT